MSFKQDEFDTVVIGGGAAGSVAAVTLAQAGRHVLLLEQTEDEQFKVGESLPPAANALLAELGLSERFQAGPHLPCYGNQAAWGSPVLHHTDFLLQTQGCGWHLDRAHFDAMLRTAAQDAGAQMQTRASATQVMRTSDGMWRVTLAEANSQSEICARWLLDCSGRRSWLARRLGVKRTHFDQLLGFVALFRPSAASADQDALTLIEAAPEGWWYTARLPAQRRVVVYLTDAGTATSRCARQVEGYLALLAQTQHIRVRLAASGYQMESLPQATSAHSAQLAQFTGDGWLVAGDAAASYDPLSSYGILSALSSGLSAGRALHAHLCGDGEALAAYTRVMQSVYTTYLQNRAFFYRYERRWPDSPFWRSRLVEEDSMDAAEE